MEGGAEGEAVGWEGVERMHVDADGYLHTCICLRKAGVAAR